MKIFTVGDEIKHRCQQSWKNFLIPLPPLFLQAQKLHHERDEALELIGCLVNVAPKEIGNAPNHPDGNEDFNAVVSKWGTPRKFDVP